MAVGMYGDGSIFYTATRVPNLADIVAVAAGFGYALALTINGTVWTLSATHNRPIISRVPILAGVAAISANFSQNAALETNGTVWCWRSSENTRPVRVGGLSGVVSIAAGDGYYLALEDDGTVWAWLSNDQGGDSGIGTVSPIAVRVDGLPRAVAIACCDGNNVALTSDGSVWQWSPSYPNIPDYIATAVNAGNTPAPIGHLSAVKAIAAGEDFDLALKTGGTVWAWGTNDLGQLGNGTYVSSATPVQVSGLTNVVAIAAGLDQSLALKSDGTVWGWGQTNYGQLGTGQTSEQATQGSPVEVPNLTDVVAIADGEGGVAIQVTMPVSISGTATSEFNRSLLSAWRTAYTASHPNVTITYATPGRTPEDWIAGKSDFAVTDDLFTPSQDSGARRHCAGNVAYIPVAANGTALTYNLPGVGTGLYLPPDVLTGLFLGRLREWDDVRIRRANPAVRLPGLPVRVVYRTDPSGDTDSLTHYLSILSPIWRAQMGAGPRVAWPSGNGADGSLGVVAQVLRLPGAIGYVDLSDALAHGLAVAELRNHAGREVMPSISTIKAAADSYASSLPDDLQQRLVDAPGAQAYPVAEYTYISLCSAQSGDRGRALLDFVRYIVTKGQAVVRASFYTPLPSPVQDAAMSALDALSEAPKPAPPAWCKEVRRAPMPLQC